MEIARCASLWKSFGAGEAAAVALRGIGFAARRGELTMIVGPSGCGKTTLLSVLAGLLPPDAGRVQVLGEDLLALSPAAAADFRARHIGFVFQSFQLLPALDALGNVALPARLAGMDARRARDAARAVLERVGLGDRLAAMPASLSGGQQQRVAVARAVVHAPELVLCDEPTSALDHASGRAVMDLLRALVDEDGRSLVVVSHDPRIHRFADRIATMEDGSLVRVQRRRFDPDDAPRRADDPVGDAAVLAALADGWPREAP